MKRTLFALLASFCLCSLIGCEVAYRGQPVVGASPVGSLHYTYPQGYDLPQTNTVIVIPGAKMVDRPAP